MKRVFFVLAIIVFALLSIHTLIAQQLLNETLIHDGETRTYTVYIPAIYDGTSPVPLLFNFHGGSGDIASQIGTSDMRPIADTSNFMLVYPQALPDPNDGGSTNWTHKEPTTVDDIFFVEAMIETLASEYIIDENRVYACGYSNGGEFTFELACRLSDRIAAIGVVARSMFIDTYEECSPSHPMAVVTIHGTEDEYEGITWAGITYYIALDEVNSYWSSFSNTDEDPTVVNLPNLSTTDGSTVEHYTWGNGDGCVSVEHFKVIGGGHDWPGTWGNMDISANVEIWNFVSKYDRNGLIGCMATSIQETMNEDKGLFVLPNPIENWVTVERNNAIPTKYHIYSKFGEILVSGTMGSDINRIDLSDLPVGIYFLRVEYQIVKLIKTK